MKSVLAMTQEQATEFVEASILDALDEGEFSPTQENAKLIATELIALGNSILKQTQQQKVHIMTDKAMFDLLGDAISDALYASGIEPSVESVLQAADALHEIEAEMRQAVS